jgi:hypothetical protein
VAKVAFALVVSAITVLTAACGNGTPDAVAHIGTTTPVTHAAASSGGGGPSANGDLPTGLEKYVTCMRTHGVADFPDPQVQVGQGNVRVRLVVPAGLASSPRFKTAQAACRSMLPAGPEQQHFTTQQQADYLKAAACMRAQGIVGFPDPLFTGGNVSFPLPAGMNANSSQFEAAREICQKLIPAGLPYSN